MSDRLFDDYGMPVGMGQPRGRAGIGYGPSQYRRQYPRREQTQPTVNETPPIPPTNATDYGTALMGWSQENWDNPNMQTPKYQLGRIFSKYNAADGFTDPMMEEIKKLFPNASASRDILTGLGDWEGKSLGDIDAIASFGGSNPSWAWQPKNEAAAPGASTTPSGAIPFFMNQMTMDVNNPSFGEMMIKQLLAQLNQQRGG